MDYVAIVERDRFNLIIESLLIDRCQNLQQSYLVSFCFNLIIESLLIDRDRRARLIDDGIALFQSHN